MGQVNALLDCFGREAAEALLVLNSKAYTGHSMGVCFEDVVAVEAHAHPSAKLSHNNLKIFIYISHYNLKIFI